MNGLAIVIGGAGFIGTNLADSLARAGERVRVVDNLSRAGVKNNWRWLREQHGERVELVVADVRDAAAMREALAEATSVFHLAAQVAVTTSLTDPITDLEINLRGTVNVLEALRERSDPPPLVFTSTNKVYGDLDGVTLEADERRYRPVDEALARRGVSEARPLSFHSPYGCSKGAADQYVLDYARCFGLPAVVFRMSCIYGPHQMGNEDQGWVAHFCIRALRDESITLFGDGKQVRDILYVEDLVRALIGVRAAARSLAGSAFNVGGGPAFSISLLELISMIEGRLGKRPAVEFAERRVSDQFYYTSDTTALSDAIGWKPRTSPAEGVPALIEWLRSHSVDASPRSRERGGGALPMSAIASSRGE